MYVILKWFLFALTILFIAAVIPGIGVSNIWTALLVILIMGLINILVRPILTIITLPINFITLGLFAFVLNALLFMLAGYVTPGFTVNGFWSALFGSLILSVLSIPIDKIGNKAEEN